MLYSDAQPSLKKSNRLQLLEREEEVTQTSDLIIVTQVCIPIHKNDSMGKEVQAKPTPLEERIRLRQATEQELHLQHQVSEKLPNNSQQKIKLPFLIKLIKFAFNIY